MAKFGTKEYAKKQMADMGFLTAPYIGSKETRTEEEIKADRKTLAENVPILGEAILAKEIADDVKDDNYLSAGLNTAALAVGLIPGFGKVANKPIRAAARAMRKDVKVKPTSVAGSYYDAPTYGDYHSRAAQVDKKKGLEKLKKLKGKNADFNLIQETVSESRIGNTRGQTAQADKVSFNPVEIKNVKGLMGEELYRSGDYSPPGRGSKLELLKKNIKEKGYKPEPITIVVREDGAPFIAEGNHRLAEALESGRPKIDANIQYLRNAEKVDGPLNPKRLKNLKSDIDLLVRTSYEIKNNKSTFNEGGVVPMNNMAKQMEMFETGGLMDEGGTVDPVSGNDVPPGSNQEEVRDDIPAQLSEGEFVFPADVVRFIGLEKLMMIRQRAKAGLQRMEDMGQMGNSEEAVMPDDLPFSIEDLDMEDDGLEMAQGGVVQAANGTFVQPTPTTPNAGVFYNPASQPTTGVAAAPMQAASASAAPSIGQAATPVQAGSGKPTMFTNYQLPQAPVPVMTAPDQLPKFLGEVAPGVGGVDYTEETYVNEAGQTIKFRRYNDGSLKDSSGNEAVIPEGYTLKSEAEKDVGTGPVKVKTATVQDDGGNDTFEEDQAKMELDQSRVDAAKAMGYTNFAGIGQGILSTLGLTTLPEGTVTGIGFVSDGKGSIFDPLTGRPIAAGIKDALKNSWNEISSTLKGEDRLTRDLIARGKEQETKFGRDFYKAAGVAKVDRIFAGIKDDIKDGKYGDVDFDDFSKDYIDDVQKSIRAEAEKGNYITEDGRIANPFEASGGKNRGDGRFDDEPAPAPAPTATPDYSGFDPSDDMDGPGDSANDGGGMGNTGSDDTGGATGGGPSSGGTEDAGDMD